MLQRVREWLALALIVLLPFHAFAVTVLTKLIAGPGHAPLSSLALWKEGVLAVILFVACVEIMRAKKMPKIDLLDTLILFLIGLAVFMAGLRSPVSLSQFALGFKYDFIPLVAFLIVRRVPWSAAFFTRACLSILWVAFLVSVYGIATLFLPDSFFYFLGYSDLHSLYVADGPIAAFQQIGGSSLHRIQSTFSGPNQFGIWLLLPLGIIAATGMGKRSNWRDVSPAGRCLFCIALGLTFCRAAWIGAFVVLIVALYPWLKVHLTRQRIIIVSVFFVLCVIAALTAFPSTILRLSSTRGHIERPIAALGKMIQHPFGLGLGSAGPATNRFSDTCVMLRPQDDPSWAKGRPDLCVFVGEKQVQPTDRVCDCPFLPEDWYLQIGVEMGFIGLILYVALMGLVFYRLKELKTKFSILHSPFSIFFAFLGVSIAGLFLHAWEDAAIAYTVWVLIGVLLAPSLRGRSHS